ncbi:hypothetical protein PINS_up017509 [Pythium insidiosum]|nr:hypothetical protein PINS_up017509 [Pythium insidiosum]
MNLHERVLSVLGCKYVDDVLIDAPYHVTKEMIASLKISTVVHGTHRDQDQAPGFSLDDHYRAAREAGIFEQIESPSTLDVNDIVARINENRERFEKKFCEQDEVGGGVLRGSLRHQEELDFDAARPNESS